LATNTKFEIGQKSAVLEKWALEVPQNSKKYNISHVM